MVHQVSLEPLDNLDKLVILEVPVHRDNKVLKDSLVQVEIQVQQEIQDSPDFKAYRVLQDSKGNLATLDRVAWLEQLESRDRLVLTETQVLRALLDLSVELVKLD